jgi:DNA-3-methyladenine glycosylase II
MLGWLQSLLNRISMVFCLNFYDAFLLLIRMPTKQIVFQDAVLNSIAGSIILPEVQSTGNVFNDVLSCIIEQQIHYRSSKKIYKRMLEKAGLDQVYLDNFEVFERLAIPTIKLSQNKIETVDRVVQFFSQQQLDWTMMSDDEVAQTLSQIKGVGKWTIDMILMYTLERPNIMPYDDFHLKQVMVQVYNLNPVVSLKRSMQEISNDWQPNRSLAVKYLLEWKKQNNLK